MMGGWWSVLGTSPRTRGKLLLGHFWQEELRNIPAHAGKTVPRHNPNHPHTEHPRARGENGFVTVGFGGFDGTSPRTRGKPLWLGFCFNLMRNIPAHAGKTSTVMRLGFVKREHPRARGENGQKDTERTPSCGTSPRTRGKHIEKGTGAWGTGNIPAHAGKTHGVPAPCGDVWEHPRARGENTY